MCSAETPKVRTYGSAAAIGDGQRAARPIAPTKAATGALAALLAPILCLLYAPSAVPAQTWTATNRTGSSFVGAGPLSPDLQQITHHYTTPAEVHDQIQVSVPATTTPSASSTCQIDAVPSPTGIFLAVAGESLRGPIPCPSGCTGSVYATASQGDQWTFTLAQPVCFQLQGSVTLFNDAGITTSQGVQFIAGGNTIASVILNATGSQQVSRSGTLQPGTYTVTISGEAEGNGAPRTASYSHWIWISFGPPAVTTQPASTTACFQGGADFSVTTSTAGAQFQWQMETSPNSWVNANNGGLPFNGGTIIASGTTTSHLHLSCNVVPGVPPVRFRCILTSPCGSATTNPATLGFTPCGCGAADITGIGGPPSSPDGLLTGDDFVAFISAFAAGDLLADITGIGGLPALPDGLITGDDFNAFIAAFAAGCP